MNWISILLNLLKLFQGKSTNPVIAPATPPVPQTIDWTNPDCHVTTNFTVKDAAWLHAWNRLANDSDGFGDLQKENLKMICSNLEKVIQILGCPISIHCMFRSIQYNEEQKINPSNDVHAQGQAADFDANKTMTIQEVKDKILPHLDELNIRMEQATTTWIHLDVRAVGPSGRYFKV